MSTFDRVTATIADLDHPAYADEHRRDVWNEASAVGYQSMSWCLLISMPILTWTLGPAGVLPLALVAVALGLPSVLVMVYAQRRGVDAWKGPGTTTGRYVAIAVITAVAIAGFIVTGLNSTPDAASGAGLAVGALTGAAVGAGGALLDLPSLDGTLVTADAIHCRSETAATVLARGGDYLFALKGNHPALHADVRAFFADPPAGCLAWHETSDADHGRIEVRRHAVTHNVDWLFSDRRYAGEPHMLGLASLAMVAREGRTTTATRYYLSSASLTPERFAEAVRAHWAIENSLHWVLDTAFDEDRARIRKDHGAENLTTIRKLALNVLQSARPDLSIRRKRNRAGWSDAFARTILAQMR